VVWIQQPSKLRRVVVGLVVLQRRPSSRRWGSGQHAAVCGQVTVLCDVLRSLRMTHTRVTVAAKLIRECECRHHTLTMLTISFIDQQALLLHELLPSSQLHSAVAYIIITTTTTTTIIIIINPGQRSGPRVHAPRVHGQFWTVIRRWPIVCDSNRCQGAPGTSTAAALDTCEPSGARVCHRPAPRWAPKAHELHHLPNRFHPQSDFVTRTRSSG
jgi:hypothetical protein